MTKTRIHNNIQSHTVQSFTITITRESHFHHSTRFEAWPTLLLLMLLVLSTRQRQEAQRMQGDQQSARPLALAHAPMVVFVLVRALVRVRQVAPRRHQDQHRGPDQSQHRGQHQTSPPLAHHSRSTLALDTRDKLTLTLGS